MHIVIGWWGIPFLITLVGIGLTLYTGAHDRADYCSGIATAFVGLVSAVAALASWLAWALCT